MRSGRSLPQALVVALLSLLALTVLFPGPLLRRQVFASSDARNADAFVLVGDASVARGEYPQWNPYLFGGMPTFGSLSYTRYVYPPAALTNFLQEHLAFPPLTWLFIHLLFGALGMALLVRRWGGVLPAQVLAALAWLLSPNVVAWAVHGHGSKLGAAMYMPWIVAGALSVLGGGGRRWVALTALLLGLQVVRGHIQITYYTLLAVGFLAVVQTLFPFLPPATGAQSPDATAMTRWRRLAALAGALALAGLLGAVLLLPVHGYAGLSIRGLAASGGGATYEYATGWSFSPAELPTLVLPSAAGFGRGTYCGQMPFTDYPNYFGFLWLGLAVAAWCGRGRQATWLGVLSLLALLVSFGRHGSPLYDLLYRHLPYFNKFRVPVMILILPTLAAAWLAGMGVTALVQEPARRRRFSWRSLLPIVLVATGALLLSAAGFAREAHLNHLRTLALAAAKPVPDAAALAAAWALHRGDLLRVGLLLLAAGGALAWSVRDERFRRRGLGWALALLIAADLGAVASRIVNPDRGLYDRARDQQGRIIMAPARPLLRSYVPPRREMGQGPVYAAAAAHAGHDRVWPLGALAADNDFMVAGVRSLGGYHPAKLAAYERIRRFLYERGEPAGRVATWLAARVVAVPGDLSREARAYLNELGLDLSAEPLARDGGMSLYENRAALLRARLYTQWTPAAAGRAEVAVDDFLARIQAGDVPFESVLTLDRAPDIALQPPGRQLPAPEFLRDDLNEVVVRTAAATPTVLLLADIAAPGWTVTVDGRPATALRGDYVLRAVAVPAGEHEVRWRYRDPFLARGLSMTAAGTVGLLLLLVPWPARRRTEATGRAKAEEAA